jgi:hypothetical protein
MIKSKRMRWGRACNTNGDEREEEDKEECMLDTGGKARSKETTKKNKK